MDWEDVLKILCCVVVLALLALAGVAITADHQIVNYYTMVSSETNAVCVWGYRNWAPNERMFCSDDPQKVTDFITKVKGLK